MTDRSGTVAVGAGLAAAHVVQTLREGGYDRPVTVVGAEPVRPYERPPLSKGYLQGQAEVSTVFVHGDTWYAGHDVDLRLGVTVTALDRSARTVALDSRDRIEYDRLVLATGASPRALDVSGADLAGVHSLRSLADAKKLREALTDGRRAVIIGAGWIGLEVAAAARAAGVDVTVLEAAPVPLLRALGERLGGYFADLHRGHGVDLRLQTATSALEGEGGKVTAVRAGSQLFPADLVVVAVGVAPNAELAAAAGLEVDNGIVVDDRLRSSDPAILAVGDVANAYNTALGARLRVEHWDNAIRQGSLAGKVILGEPAQYDWQPYFFTDQYELGMEYVGHGAPDDDVVIRGDIGSGEFIAFWLRDAVITAAMNVNIWDVNDELRRLVGAAAARDKLADPEVPLEAL